MGKESREMGLLLGSRGVTICLPFARSGDNFSTVQPRSRFQLILCKLYQASAFGCIHCFSIFEL